YRPAAPPQTAPPSAATGSAFSLCLPPGRAAGHVNETPGRKAVSGGVSGAFWRYKVRPGVRTAARCRARRPPGRTRGSWRCKTHQNEISPSVSGAGSVPGAAGSSSSSIGSMSSSSSYSSLNSSFSYSSSSFSRRYRYSATAVSTPATAARNASAAPNVDFFIMVVNLPYISPQAARLRPGVRPGTAEVLLLYPTLPGNTTPNL